MGQEMAGDRIYRENTGAVIVTYNPDPGLDERLDKVREQVCAVLIVDNASYEAREMIERCAALETVDCIWNQTNLGLATALNQGVEWAGRKQLKWLLTLDQDTVLNERAVEVLSEAFDDCGAKDKVAIVGGNYVDRLTGVPFIPTLAEDGCKWIDVPTVITSGSVLSLEAAEVVGPFRDDFFIDEIDDEYCLRCRREGFRVILSREPVMEHTIGYPRYYRFLWKKLISPGLSPLRRYYRHRNHVVMIREYRRLEPGWVKFSINVRLKELILVALLERGRVSKLWYALRGIVDGMIGRMGSREVRSSK